jgi:hypothetical protein
MSTPLFGAISFFSDAMRHIRNRFMNGTLQRRKVSRPRFPHPFAQGSEKIQSSGSAGTKQTS